MIRFLAHFLIVLAAWTLVIKFAFPMAYALAEEVAIGRYIMWDFWWAAHLGLAWSLLNWNRFTVPLALLIGITEIVIVVVKLGLFLDQPDWTIWRTNWFINKLFVLTVFVLLLGSLAARRRAVSAQPSLRGQ